jgi:hypothetical protein
MTKEDTTQVKDEVSTDEQSSTVPLAEYAISETTVKRARWENLQVAPCENTNHCNVCNYSHPIAEKADHTHTVTLDHGMPIACTCKAFQYNEGLCKHCLAVAADADAIDTATPEQSNDTDTTETRAVTDGGTPTESHESEHTDDCDGCDETGKTATATDGPQTDHWGHALQQFPDEPVGAGERCECQACGERRDVAMVAATADTTCSNWEEFYHCQRCGARGSFRFEGHPEGRTWTGMIAYPDTGRRGAAVG